MKLNLFLVPRTAATRSKKLIARKLISTILTSLALTGAAFVVKTVRHTAALAPTVTFIAKDEINIPTGLSRRRFAFNKALNMLADAAEADTTLADYYKSVTKRVKGGRAKGSNSSGIQVVKADRKADSYVASEMSLAKGGAAETTLHNALQSVVSLAKSIVGPEPAASRSEASSTDALMTEDAPQRFTTGDITFDTNPAIEHWMNYYSATARGRQTMAIGIGRSNSYLEMARVEFRNAGVPEDLVWLAFVESVWDPKSVSPAAAGGIWQFIPATATDYGLRVESGYDERADPAKQTRAAAIYLHDLYTLFGDWALAMAAYNSGEPRVMGAIVKNGSANFWDLYNKQLLPKETCDYVPKILAAIRVAGQAQDYGLLAMRGGSSNSSGS
jgi:hypothetical protein